MTRQNSLFTGSLKMAIFAALFGATSAMAAIPNTGDKVGGLITVKTGALRPSVASDAAGDSAVAWDVAGGKIVVQRYDADGNPVGARFQANTITTGNNEGSKIAMDAAGDFVVVWTGDRATVTPNVFAQLFDKTGAKVGSEFQVNQTPGTAFPNSNELFPNSVAMDAAGDFVVVWTGTDAGDGTTPDLGIFAQRFDKTGAALTGADIAVNATTAGRQVSPAIAMSGNGAYVVAWTGVDAGDGSTPDEGIFAQTYDATGAVVTAEFAVNTDTAGAETLPAAGMDLAGDFVIAWSSDANFATNLDIHARRFDHSGAAVGGEFLVNTAALGDQADGTVGVQSHASVAMDVNGDFIIGWDSEFDDTGALGDYANFYAADGSLKGGTKIEGLTDTGFAPAVAVDAGGDSFISATITTNAVPGLYAQRIAGFNPLDLSASLSTTVASTLKPGDAIALTASITNNATAGTTTGIPAIDGALSTATTVQAALTLPAGTTLSSTSGSNWTCPSKATADVLTCTFAGGLAAGVVTSDLTVNLQASSTGGVSSFTHDASGLQPDASAGNNEASVGVTVDNPPVAQDSSLVVALNSATGGNATATDVDGDPLTYSVVTNVANGLLTFNPDGSFSYTPNNGFSGHDSFTFKANDGTFDSNAGTITLRINNQAPTANDGVLTVNQDSQNDTGTVTATDSDGDPVTFSKVTDPAHGAVTVNANGSFSYTPTAGFSGADSFSFKANDGLADSNAAIVSITVDRVNHAPVANDGVLTVNEDSRNNTGTFSATDVDTGDTLAFSVVASPKHGTITFNATGGFSYTPNALFFGTDSIGFKVNDGTVDSNTGTVTITVTHVNHAPAAIDGVLTVTQDSSNDAGTLVATDADGDPVTFSKVTDPTHGAVTVNANGSFSYTPTAGFSGADSFTFKANDGTVDSNTATVSITVTKVNHAPTATAGTLAMDRNTPATGTVKGSDPDSDALTFSVVTQAAHGAVVMQANGSFTYTPAKAFVGTDHFTFKANDGTVDSAAATITVTVTEHAPVALAETFSMTHNTEHKGTLKFTDKDAGDKHTFSKVTSPKHGTWVLNTTTGAFSYTPAKNFKGTDRLVFKVSDGDKTSDAGVNITVK
jgi:VCBS repeat-containing protein